MNLVSLLFGFHGRINRLQYWLGNLSAGVGGGVLLFAVSMIFAPSPTMSKDAVAAAAPMMSLAFALVMLALSWCGFAIQVKRFHDRGRSGYWALAPVVPMTMMVVTVAGGIAANAPPEQVVPQILPWFGVLGLINLWFLIDLGMLAGTNGPNKYDHTPGSGGAPLNAGSGGSAPSGTGASTAAIFGNAEQAMARAIAEQARATATARAAPAQVRVSASAPGSFGRKPAR